jgi:hypothetical protein
MSIPARWAAGLALSGLVAAGFAPSSSAVSKWKNAETLSGAGQDAYLPQVDVGGGTAVVVWQRYDGHTWRVQAARRLGDGTWSHPVTLSAPDRAGVVPQVAVDRHGNAIAVWQSEGGSHWRIQSARRPAGGTWSRPVTLSAAGQGAISPQVVVNWRGTALAVWVRSDGSKDRIQAARRPAGRAWARPVTLSVAGDNSREPQAAITRRGTAVVVWERWDSANSNWRVDAARRPAHGTWGSAVTLSANDIHARAPQVAMDGKGTAVAVWSTVGLNWGRIQAARRPAGRGWTNPVDVSGSEGFSYAQEAQVAVNRDGTTVVVWSLFQDSNSWIQAARRPAGRTWGRPVTLAQTNTWDTRPKVDVNPHGAAVAVWQGYDGVKQRIDAARSAAGRSWSAPVTLSARGRHAVDHQVVTGRTTIAVWARRDRAMNWRVQAAEFQASETARP